MICRNCRGERFTIREYKTSKVRAPALECETCGVLDLDEAAAASEDERESVRLAKAARADSSGSWSLKPVPRGRSS
jgi:hypothetical protein